MGESTVKSIEQQFQEVFDALQPITYDERHADEPLICDAQFAEEQ